MIKTSRSLAVTLGISIVTLSFIVLFIASTFALYFNFKSQEKIVAARQQIIARRAANTVHAFIQEKLILMKACARVGSLATSSPEDQRKVLEKLLGIEPAFREIVLTAPEKEPIKVSRLSSFVKRSLIDEAGKDMFSHLREGRNTLSQITIDETT